MRTTPLARHLAVAALLGLSLAGARASAALPVATYLRVQSWNARHMGWAGQQDWAGYAAQIWNDFGSSASAANGLDLVALQEVMYDTSITSLLGALESISGVDWSATTTAPIGRTSYKERYSIVYRTDRVSLLASSVWNDVGDKFEREPQIARFRVLATGADVTFINWHTIWGTSAERQQEISDIATVFDGVQDGNASDQDVILLGDHNASATSAWWTNLTNGGVVSPAVSHKVNELTTLNTSCAFASAYDHFWMQTAYVAEYSSSGRDWIADLCAFSDGLSDHAPVWLKLYSDGDDD